MSVTPLTEASGVIQLHTVAALAAFVLGLVQFGRTKGTASHRALGYLWAGLMIAIAGTSFFIHELRLVGPFSPIHLLSIFTLIMVPVAVYAARRGRVGAHRRAMILIFTGALVVAGLFTFVPGRIMHAVVFGG